MPRMRRSTRRSSPGCKRAATRRRKYVVRSNGGRWLAASEPQLPGIRSVTSVIVDRRPDKGKSTANRQRVLKRLSGALKAQVDQLIARRKLSDHDKSTEVTIERKDVKEPSFSIDSASGDSARVVPGNQHYRVGDKIPRDPSGGQGQGRGAGEGDDEDVFRFALS